MPECVKGTVSRWEHTYLILKGLLTNDESNRTLGYGQ